MAREKTPKAVKFGVYSHAPLVKRLEKVQRQKKLTRSQAVNEAIEQYVEAHEQARAA